MTLEPPSPSTMDYVPPSLSPEHGSTSAVDLDQDWRHQRLLFSSHYPSPSGNDDIAFGDYTASILDESSSTRTDYLVKPIDLRSRLNAEIDDRMKIARGVYHAYWIRIESLISDAILESFTVNRESEWDFWSFVKSVPFASKGELVLLDNGNLRAVWDGEDGSHLGLQFLGGRMLQFVIFRRRKGSAHISRVAGRETFEGVRKQVRIFDLEVLLST